MSRWKRTDIGIKKITRFDRFLHVNNNNPRALWRCYESSNAMEDGSELALEVVRGRKESNAVARTSLEDWAVK